ncbi:MAG: ImmA/IrrE family metallo-endopeptidase [Bacillus sp. (in: firmicutes)]
MTRNVLEAVNKARESFEIESYPGDFFAQLEKVNYTEKYGLLLFKEDIDKLSGFIGYGPGNIAIICVNYKRSYGHQNFTLAHEVGHWFLHKGTSISDDDVALFSTDLTEKEANDFAKELLYPEELSVKDYYTAIEQELFQDTSRDKLGKYVNTLCHRYCLSFDVVLRTLLFKHHQVSSYKEIRKQIEKSLGGKISEVFDKDFYVPNDNLIHYQQLKTPYEMLIQKVNLLVDQKKIGKATGEAIILRNKMENK